MGNKGLALVTGGTRGIGRAIVERLASDGYYVLFTYVTNSKMAGELVEALLRAGRRVKAVRCDIGVIADCENLFREVDGAKEPFSLFVNNAATLELMSIADLDEGMFDRTIAINLKAPLFLSKLASTRLADNGRIIYISSISEHLASPMYVSYAASKAALRALVGAFAQELGSRNITVNALSPGMTDTEMTRELAAVAPEHIKAVVEKTALKRLGSPDDLANAVAMFAGPDSAWITGQVIECSGGYNL